MPAFTASGTCQRPLKLVEVGNFQLIQVCMPVTRTPFVTVTICLLPAMYSESRLKLKNLRTSCLRLGARDITMHTIYSLFVQAMLITLRALHVQVVYINDIEKRNEYSQIGSLRTNVRT